MVEKTSFDRINFPMVLLNLIQSINEQTAKVFLEEIKDGVMVGYTTDSKMDGLWASVCIFEDEMYSYLSQTYFNTTKPFKEIVEKKLGTENSKEVFVNIRKVFRLIVAEASAKGFLIRQSENEEIIDETESVME